MSATRPLRRRPGRPVGRALLAASVAALLASTLTGCGSDAEASDDAEGTVTIARAAGDFERTTLDVPVQEDIRAKVPKAILDKGKLVVGVGALPDGFPPLAYVGDDDETITGAEPDLGRLVAAVLGLEPEVVNATWDNLFVGIDSGATDVGFSNITDTEKRKETYDFAGYRLDNVAFAVRADSTLEFTGDPAPLDGLKIAVSAGTNQEKILVEFSESLKRAGGKGIDIKYFPDNSSQWTALDSGQIDAYLGPNPGIAYQQSQTGEKYRTAGTYSGAGSSLQGLIAATTKKDSGLVEAVAAAINYLIENGQYEKWLATYNLSNEAVEKSEINPPGLPLDNQ